MSRLTRVLLCILPALLSACRIDSDRDRQVVVVRHPEDAAATAVPSATQPVANTGHPITVQVTDNTANDSPALAQMVGQPCTVHLRRDALGMSNNSPLGPSPGNQWTAAAAVSGSLRQVTPDHIVLSTNEGLHWIPKPVILDIEFPRPAPR